MAELQVGGKTFDIDVVVFDKDGTLIDFHLMWGSRAKEAVDALLDKKMPAGPAVGDQESGEDESPDE